MRALDRRTQVAPALLLFWFGCALGALPLVVVAQPWSPLVRESQPSVVEEVSFEAQSIREVDPGVFEVRLMYEPIRWACVRRGSEGECEVWPNRRKRIMVIRIRCQDMSYEEVTVWVDVGFGNWGELPLSAFRHPPGWRYDVAHSTGVAAARDLVCATVPP